MQTYTNQNVYYTNPNQVQYTQSQKTTTNSYATTHKYQYFTKQSYQTTIPQQQYVTYTQQQTLPQTNITTTQYTQQPYYQQQIIQEPYTAQYMDSNFQQYYTQQPIQDNVQSQFYISATNDIANKNIAQNQYVNVPQNQYIEQNQYIQNQNLNYFDQNQNRQFIDQNQNTQFIDQNQNPQFIDQQQYIQNQDNQFVDHNLNSHFIGQNQQQLLNQNQTIQTDPHYIYTNDPKKAKNQEDALKQSTEFDEIEPMHVQASLMQFNDPPEVVQPTSTSPVTEPLINAPVSKNSKEIAPKVQPPVEESPYVKQISNVSNVSSNLGDKNINQTGELQRSATSLGEFDEINASHLPTINSIMTGKADVLPPPKQQK